MSKEYDNTNTFVLFKQDVDEGSNKPLFTGTANMGGKEMRAAVWVNKDAKATLDSTASSASSNLRRVRSQHLHLQVKKCRSNESPGRK